MKIIAVIMLGVFSLTANAQDINLLLKEASNLEKQLKEPEALDKYTQVAATDTKNIPALVKCAELNAAIGARQADKNWKAKYYTTAQTFARQAIAADSNNADANYAMALVSGKMTETAEENKQIVAYVRQTKIYADKALAINPGHAKANYTIGKWHYEMVNLSWVKKAAVKVAFGGLPKGDIDSAIFYMEKCKTLDQYFVRNYFDLAKAYQYNSKPSKEMEVLNKLVKLPTRTADDAALKAEAKKRLDEML